MRGRRVEVLLGMRRAAERAALERLDAARRTEAAAKRALDRARAERTRLEARLEAAAVRGSRRAADRARVASFGEAVRDDLAEANTEVIRAVDQARLQVRAVERAVADLARTVRARQAAEAAQAAELKARARAVDRRDQGAADDRFRPR